MGEIINQDKYIEIVTRKRNVSKKIEKWLQSDEMETIVKYTEYNTEAKEKYGISFGQTAQFCLEKDSSSEKGYKITNIKVLGEENDLVLPEVDEETIKKNREEAIKKHHEKENLLLSPGMGIRRGEMKDIHKASDVSRGKKFT